jgi:putative ABC transport system permease protein
LEVDVDGMVQDFKFAVRTLAKAPGFTTMAVLTLAIGIGANAAIFGVVNSVLLRPLPYGDAGQVATIWSSWIGFPKSWVSEAEYRAYLTQNRAFEDLSLWYTTSANFSSVDDPERVDAAETTENLTAVLDIQMAAGRYFTTGEAIQTDSLLSGVVVISHEAWERRYAKDPGVLGRLVEVNGRNREVIGILPEGFKLPTDYGSIGSTDIYFPRYLPRTPVANYPVGGGSHGGFVVGRLRPGMTAADGQRDLDNIINRLEAELGVYPAVRSFRGFVFDATDDILGSLRPALLALLGTVVFVLLIACANVANLQLTRGQTRQGEMAVRAAVGAGRGRIVRQLLTESLVLALVGGALGIGLAFGGVGVFKALNPGNLPRISEVSLDGTVLVFSAFLTLLTVVLFGALPALRTVRSDLQSNLGRRGDGGVGKVGWQGTLVALEMALAVVLVVGAGLMVRTFGELSRIDTGFEGDNLLTLAVSLPTTSYPDAGSALAFHNEAMRQMEEVPGVQIATAARILPLASQIGDWTLRIENYVPPENLPLNGDWQFAAPGYFGAMGIPLLRGRPIEGSDHETAMLVAVVNEAFVRHFWPNGENPIGERFRMGGDQSTRPFVTIVGVVGDVTHNGLTAEIKRKFYIPLAQWSLASGNRPTSLRYVVKVAGNVAALTSPIRDVIRRMDPSLAVAEVQTVEDIVSGAVAQPRFTVVLMAAFSGIALLLALVGIYGVISYGVSQRTQEIGVRMALGAQREQVVNLMLRKGITMVGVGLGLGVVTALIMTRFLNALLYNVSAQDPGTFAAVGLGFAGVAWLATYIPSRRAAGVDPIRALKSD